MERNTNFKHCGWEYKWFSCYRKQFGSFSKKLHRITIQPSNSTSRYIPPKLKTGTQILMHPCSQQCYNNEKAEKLKCPSMVNG